jgi:hypothetical protein
MAHLRRRSAQLGRSGCHAKGAWPAALLLPVLLAGCMTPRPQVSSTPLVLDAADPVITVTLQGVPMRLRVVLDQRNSIELNEDAAARLDLPWDPDAGLNVGRITLPSESAIADFTLGSLKGKIQVSHHHRACCDGVDGEVGPDLLPFPSVRWERRDAPAANGERALLLEHSDLFGLASPAGELLLRFDLVRADSLATAASGAILARDWGGDWAGDTHTIRAAFDVKRPVRLMAFRNPGNLAGFRFDALLVRTLDFPSRDALPSDPVAPGDIVVARPIERQRPWPAVTLGTDRLNRCAEIIYTAEPRSLTLRCAFDQP